jgi:hypothetical protein
MSLLHFFLSGLGLFALFQFLILPRLRHRLRVDGTVLSVRRAAMLAVLGWVRSVLLLVTLTTGVLVVLLLLLRLGGGSTIREISANVDRLQAWRDRLAAFHPYWSGGILLVLVGVLALYAYRRGKVRLEKAFREVYEQQMNQLVEQAQRGELVELPPTPEMMQLVQAHQQAQEFLAQIERDPRLSESQRQALRDDLQRRLVFCRENWVLIDLHRRLHLRVDPDVAAPPPPKTRLEKLQAFFLSQGLIVNLNRATRLLYLAGMVLLTICLVGVCSPSVGTALTARVVALDDLRVRLSREQVQREWEEAKTSLGEPQATLTAEDEKVLSRVAAQYEQSVSQSDLWRRASVVQPSVYKLRALAVQDRILERVAKPAQAPRLNPRLVQHEALSRVEGLQPPEKFVARAYEHALNPTAPTTEHGRRFLGELKDVARRSPSLLGRLRAEIRLFRQPVGAGALGGELTTQVLSLLTGAEHPDLVPLLSGIDRRQTAALMQRVLGDQADHALTRLARGERLAEVLHSAGAEQADLVLARLSEGAEMKQTMRTVVSKLPAEGEVISRLNTHPPGIDVRPEPHVDLPRASQAVERLHADTKATVDALAQARGRTPPARIDAQRFTKALSGYADDLPAQLGAEQKTLHGKLLAKLEPTPKNPIGSVGGSFEKGGGSQLKFYQGRDFNRLRGFSRVGGVLIGQEPSRREGAALDVVDVRWEVDGPQMRLILVLADGQEVRSRPYRRSLVYLSLAYAADGRKVAVTIADAYPLGEHNILLHPALVDTPFGRRVIELDQFINRYTRQDEEHRKAVETFYAHNELYRWAWGKRVLAMSRQEIERVGRMLKAEARDKLLEDVRQITEHARDMVDSADPKQLARAWAARGRFGDPQYSPWRARKRYYDENLVRLIRTQAEKADNLEAFGRDFDAAASSDFQQLLASFDAAVRGQQEQEANNALKEIFFYWLTEPPTFGLRNIVREQSFAADVPQLVLRDGQAPGVPFDLFLQMVFTSEPAFVGRYPEPTEGEDDRWWEFAALSPSIRQEVAQGVAQDPRAQTILADVAEFTYLQRLFRAALNGHLGEGFAVEKLVGLADAAVPATSPPPTRTLRWDMREGPSEVVVALGWLQVLGNTLPHLDPSWQPTWLDRLRTRNPLDEADFVKVIGEWSDRLQQELAKLPANEGRQRWCQDTFTALEPYRRLATEAATEQRRFKQALDRLQQQSRGGAVSGAWRRDWDKEFEAHTRWQQDWGRRWAGTAAGRKFEEPGSVPPGEASKLTHTVESLQTLIRLVEQVQAAREIRAAVGVARDERQAADERVAPLPSLDW